jgi:hypothetical protein
MTERAVRSSAAYGVGRVSAPRMTPPKIQALGVTQEGAPTRWKATGYVDGVGWLEAWGTSLPGPTARKLRLDLTRNITTHSSFPFDV